MFCLNLTCTISHIVVMGRAPAWLWITAPNRKEVLSPVSGPTQCTLSDTFARRSRTQGKYQIVLLERKIHFKG